MGAARRGKFATAIPNPRPVAGAAVIRRVAMVVGCIPCAIVTPIHQPVVCVSRQLVAIARWVLSAAQVRIFVYVIQLAVVVRRLQANVVIPIPHLLRVVRLSAIQAAAAAVGRIKSAALIPIQAPVVFASLILPAVCKVNAM